MHALMQVWWCCVDTVVFLGCALVSSALGLCSALQRCSPLLGPLFSSLFSTGLSLRSPTVLVSTSLRAPVIRHSSVDRHEAGLVAGMSEVWSQSQRSGCRVTAINSATSGDTGIKRARRRERQAARWRERGRRRERHIRARHMQSPTFVTCIL